MKTLIEPFEVRRGMNGLDYFEQQCTVISIVKAVCWKQVKKYDETGWLSTRLKEDLEELGCDINTTYLVAVNDRDGDTNVYTYGEDGVACYEEDQS